MEDSKANYSPEEQAAPLVLGIIPIEFSGPTFQCGRISDIEQESVKELRQKHGRTHAFRFDNRDSTIANVSLGTGIEAMGLVTECEVADNFLLLAEALNLKLRWWLQGRFKVLRYSKPLLTLGKRDKLLSTSLSNLGIQKPDPNLDVFARWSFDFRMFLPANSNRSPWLGLVADVGTSTVIDIPLKDLLAKGFDPVGHYVGIRAHFNDGSAERLQLLGQVSKVNGDDVLLTDLREGADGDHVRAESVFVEPRRETLETMVYLMYPKVAGKALMQLQKARAPYLSGDGKLRKIRDAIAGFNKTLDDEKQGSLDLSFGDGLHARFGELIDQRSDLFPSIIETNRPPMLFGPNGYDRSDQPDIGIKRYGPFQYTQNPINDPTIVVLCEKQSRGRMDEFLKLLRDGINDDTGRFQGGLVGKFRLTSLRFQYAEIVSGTADAYRTAADDSLSSLPRRPALALIQVRDAHRKRAASDNPYFVAKSRFMRAGVPVQAVRLETVDNTGSGRPYILNNLALASYAKVGGIPWVISTPGVPTHELVIGIGCASVGNSRLGERTTFVGITTLFQGDGRYLVWGITREATFDNYPEALLESLRISIRFVKEQNRWESGDPVRLVFHVYKPLKRVEIEAAKGLVSELLSDNPVEFAFLDLSHRHPYQVFDPSQSGRRYWSIEDREHRIKGTYAPSRGTALLLGPRVALLQLVGPAEVKTWDQGLPKPLLVELHQDSDFVDLTYLVRQVFHFSFMSWRSFFPSDEPVTISYSRWISALLGNLRAVPDWDSAALNEMRDRRAMWFL
jgi:hypothetical protein